MTVSVNPIGPLRKVLSESTGAEAQFTGELRQTLRSRLVLLCVLILATAAFEPVNTWLESATRSGWQAVERLLSLATLAAFTPPFVLLLIRRNLSLRGLRAIEAYLVIGVTATLVGSFLIWHEQHWLEGIAREGQEPNFMEIVGDSMSFPWFVLIVFYGACIPNTGRRCALVVGLISAAAIGEVFLLAAQGGDLAPLFLKNVLAKLIFWLTMASAVAVYGSQKMSQLRREAFAARRLGQYQLKKSLGAGGMGEVYLAEHQFLRRPCAVKLIRPEKAGDEKALARFQREVQATATLTHGSVVEIFDYGRSEDGTFYYVMEYLPGLNLQELVQRYGPLPPERAVHLVRQVCQGLREAHSCGLIHRDIKPSNILVCERGLISDVAKILDFGLVHEISHLGPRTETSAPSQVDGETADASEALTQAGAMVGTPAFMSPEQLSGMPLDGRTDLYSLGLTAYFLMTGINPLARSTVTGTIEAHRNDAPVPLINACSAVDVDLNTIIMRCLAKDRDRRFSGAEELENALARCGCANRWTAARAAVWWKQNSLQSAEETTGR